MYKEMWDLLKKKKNNTKQNSTEQNLKILLALFMDWATSHLAVRKELHKVKDVDGQKEVGWGSS